jgi:t-SNARE complex subunit (syntaxin)
MNEILLGGMALGILIGGVNADKQIEQINESVETMTNKINNYKDKWKQILIDQSKINAEISTDLNNTAEEITAASIKLGLQKNIHQTKFRKIQIFGISFILFTIFLLILKYFGFENIINDIVLWPIRKIFN